MTGEQRAAEPAPREAQQNWLDEHRDDLVSTWRANFRSSSGFDVQPVYTQADLDQRGWQPAADLGLPGEEPFTRGLHAGGYRHKLWNVEMYAGFGSAEDANARYKYLIEQGSTGGVSIALDLPTQIGLDSDHALAADEVGQIGVALCSLADVERMFDGIPLDRAGHLFTTANCIGPIAAAWFLALARRQGVATESFTVQIQNDPIKEYIARGTQFLPIEASVRLATDCVRYINDVAPNWLPISVSGSHMKQAGSSCVEEAAFTICNGIAYVETCLRNGADIERLGPAIELHFCTEMDFFEEVAKYRAVRKVWTALVRERFGGRSARSQQFRLHATTSGRPLTKQQPLNNISRITLQILAQVLGGCEQTRTASFDEAVGIPTEEAARTSIRANQIVAHETGIPFTVDPLGGSYYVEAMTKDFESAIWKIIDKVESLGGAVEATRQGFFQDAIMRGAYQEQMEVDADERIVVGVNAFQIEETIPTPTFKVDHTAVDRQSKRLGELRATRDNRAVQTALRAVHDACRNGDNVMPSVVAAVEAYATLGEICDVWREVFGTYVQGPVRL